MTSAVHDDVPVDDRPRDIDAEKAVLGACLLSPEAVATVSGVITADDFYRPAHGAVFDTIVGLWEAGHPADPVSIAATLDQRGALARVGGAPYLHTLIAAVPTATNAGYYAEIVADRAARARLVDASVRLRQLALHGGQDDTAGVLERARQTVEDATRSRTEGADDAGAWIGDFVRDHVASWDRPDPGGIPIPYRDLNDVLGGLRPGQMVIIAGRPGAGKTVIGTDWAAHAASRGWSVMMASLEMTRQGVVNRVIAARTKVRINAIEHRNVSSEDRLEVMQALDDIEKLPLRIVDKFSTSLGRLRDQARQQARTELGCDLLIVDYIQLMEGNIGDAEREQISAHSRGLKLLAAELGIPVVVIAQLNRGPEQRQDKVPVASDLKGSGSLEQDADIILLIHRPDAYERDSPRAGEADLILAKHRNGPTGTITVAHQLHFSRFVDIAGGWQ